MMAKARLCLICLISLKVLSGCSQPDKTISKCETILKVDVAHEEISFESIFESCEIIPLESEPQSLLSDIDKAICFEDSILLLDMRRSIVFLFNGKGNFLTVIGERGQGPEDYLLCYDFSINKFTKEIALLSPYGEILNYNLKGQFLNRKKLPSKPNYFACSWLNQCDLALWSAVDSEEGGVSVVNIEFGRQYFEDWYNDRIIDMCSLKPFYNWNESVCFSAPLQNIIYSVTDTCMQPVYMWDFGEKNISSKYISQLIEIHDPSERNNRLISDMESGSLTYPIYNGENKYYYFVALANGIGEEREITNIFYDKSDSSSLVFKHFKEGITLRPIFMNDEFMLSVIPHDEIGVYNSLFNADYECKEDENPCLAKFYFKQ